ncbi:MAG: DinB family protein [Saprospiraceae bacterium]|nr:DinB family protein [Saprospiraceae bacterium]
MRNRSVKTARRTFIEKSILLTTGISALSITKLSAKTVQQTSENIYIIGPRAGYTDQVGTLLSTMTMMRTWVIDTVRNLTTEQLDYQIDDQSNSIGAMLLHLAATERYYQLNTFEGMEWDSWSDDIKKEWDVAMDLGDDARKHIVGHKIDYYLQKLEEVRNVTKKEFAKRDDAWLQKSEPFFGNQPTNNYCKWFHVCEHESNHNGQMKFITKRLPS